MREGEHDSNQSNCEHHQTQNYNKKRTIKKDKNIKEIQAHALKLTKEERAKVQKQKNREAAQRSRNLHKQYVINLQKQLEELKDHLNKRLCFRCRQQIEPLALDNEIHHHLQFTRKIDESREEICQNNSTENQINLLADEVEMPESFLRMQSQSDFSYIKMMLFISMIAIGVFLYIQPGQDFLFDVLKQAINYVSFGQIFHLSSAFPDLLFHSLSFFCIALVLIVVDSSRKIQLKISILVHWTKKLNIAYNSYRIGIIISRHRPSILTSYLVQMRDDLAGWRSYPFIKRVPSSARSPALCCASGRSQPKLVLF